MNTALARAALSLAMIATLVGCGSRLAPLTSESSPSAPGANPAAAPIASPAVASAAASEGAKGSAAPRPTSANDVRAPGASFVILPVPASPTPGAGGGGGGGTPAPTPVQSTPPLPAPTATSPAPAPGRVALTAEGQPYSTKQSMSLHVRNGSTQRITLPNPIGALHGWKLTDTGRVAWSPSENVMQVTVAIDPGKVYDLPAVAAPGTAGRYLLEVTYEDASGARSTAEVEVVIQ